MRDAIGWINSPPKFRQIDGGAEGECLKNVRTAFGIPALYGTAAEAGHASDLKPGSVKGSAPRNRPYFYDGGSHGAGHVGITDGYTAVGKNLRIWTTDWPNPLTGKRDGKWRRVRADKVGKAWNLKALGWGSVLNGVKIDL